MTTDKRLLTTDNFGYNYKTSWLPTITTDNIDTKTIHVYQLRTSDYINYKTTWLPATDYWPLNILTIRLYGYRLLTTDYIE